MTAEEIKSEIERRTDILNDANAKIQKYTKVAQAQAEMLKWYQK